MSFGYSYPPNYQPPSQQYQGSEDLPDTPVAVPYSYASERYYKSSPYSQNYHPTVLVQPPSQHKFKPRHPPPLPRILPQRQLLGDYEHGSGAYGSYLSSEPQPQQPQPPTQQDGTYETVPLAGPTPAHYADQPGDYETHYRPNLSLLPSPSPPFSHQQQDQHRHSYVSDQEDNLQTQSSTFSLPKPDEGHPRGSYREDERRRTAAIPDYKPPQLRWWFIASLILAVGSLLAATAYAMYILPESWEHRFTVPGDGDEGDGETGVDDKRGLEGLQWKRTRMEIPDSIIAETTMPVESSGGGSVIVPTTPVVVITPTDPAEVEETKPDEIPSDSTPIATPRPTPPTPPAPSDRGPSDYANQDVTTPISKSQDDISSAGGSETIIPDRQDFADEVITVPTTSSSSSSEEERTTRGTHEYGKDAVIIPITSTLTSNTYSEERSVTITRTRDDYGVETYTGVTTLIAPIDSYAHDTVTGPTDLPTLALPEPSNYGSETVTLTHSSIPTTFIGTTTLEDGLVITRSLTWITATASAPIPTTSTTIIIAIVTSDDTTYTETSTSTSIGTIAPRPTPSLTFSTPATITTTDDQGHLTTLTTSRLAQPSTTTLFDAQGRATATATLYPALPTSFPVTENLVLTLPVGHNFIGTFLPTMLATTVMVVIRMVDLEVKRYLPFHRLASTPHGAGVGGSLCRRTAGWLAVFPGLSWSCFLRKPKGNRQGLQRRRRLRRRNILSGDVPDYGAIDGSGSGNGYISGSGEIERERESSHNLPGAERASGRRYRESEPEIDTLVLLTSTLLLLSAVLVPLAAESVALKLYGSCSQFSFDGCRLGLAVFPFPARLSMSVMGAMLVLLTSLLLSLGNWRTGLGGEPWSLAGVASIGGNEGVRRLLARGLGNGQKKIDRREMVRVLEGEGKRRRFGMGWYRGRVGGEEWGIVSVGDEGWDGVGDETGRDQGREEKRGDDSDVREEFVRDSGTGLDAGREVLMDGEPVNPEGESKGRKRRRQKKNMPFVMLTVWGRLLFFVFLAGVEAVVLYYNNTGGDTDFERFMDDQGFGVRFMWTALGVLATFFWSSYFHSVATMSPYILMSHLPQPAHRSILMHPPSNPFVALFHTITATVKTHSTGTTAYFLLVSFTAVLSEFMPLLLNQIAYRPAQTWEVHLATYYASITILSLMMLVLLLSFVSKVVQWPHMPVDPSTVAGMLFLVADSWMMWSFEGGLGVLGTEERNARIKIRGERYEYGEIVGNGTTKGGTRVGVDCLDNGDNRVF